MWLRHDKIRLERITQPTGVSTIAIRTSQPHIPKIAIELSPLPPQEKLFFKISPSKNFKTSNEQQHKQTQAQLDNDSKNHGRQRLYNLDRKKASL